MPEVNEKLREGDVIVYEAPKDYSRDQVTVADGQGILEPGTVLGQVTASGEFVVSPDASTIGIEGAETATAVLARRVDASNGAVPAVVLARHALVNRARLIFDDTVNDAAKRTAKVGQLRDAGIIARTGA